MDKTQLCPQDSHNQVRETQTTIEALLRHFILALKVHTVVSYLPALNPTLVMYWSLDLGANILTAQSLSFLTCEIEVIKSSTYFMNCLKS